MIEYRVIPVTRYIVTRYEQEERSGSSETRGEYDRADTAHAVAYALCRMEHDKSGEPLESERFIYPAHPEMGAVTPDAVCEARKQQLDRLMAG